VHTIYQESHELLSVLLPVPRKLRHCPRNSVFELARSNRPRRLPHAHL